jgi:membrane fusion protein (multidrug efflux system)
MNESQPTPLLAPAPPLFKPVSAGVVLRIALGLVAAAAVGTGSFAYLRYAERYETTDDAYLEGNLHPLSTQVNGTVIEVLTDDNKIVHAGEPLLRLDPRDFAVRLEEAKTDLLSAESVLPQAEAQVLEAQARVALSESGIAQTKAQLDEADLDLRRADQLVHERAIPRAQYDTAATNEEVATAGTVGARASRQAALATLASTRAALTVTKAKREAALARVHDAELQLSYATVLAPADGRVGRKSVEVGQRVQAGQALLAVVGADAWVVANLKEGQLTRIRPGQEVDVAVDAIADHAFRGTVESFSPGTGAKFALLPPDNATGNFTKIVQRLPVKIRFLPESIRGYEDKLSPGLSAVVKVRVHP